ncbi:hypothetical protein BDQ12DRAFT_476853 [Crucibulum laeve]|uniref:Uncharacterized protein n=1 Tax=Crucibulum laeve TaxID=68775 RepID=A0A5C3LJ10_9AGAR|nr:hypothetical protein BDQ12DRAFT_476853 [Crucibulum laeve]
MADRNFLYEVDEKIGGPIRTSNYLVLSDWEASQVEMTRPAVRRFPPSPFPIVLLAIPDTHFTHWVRRNLASIISPTYLLLYRGSPQTQSLPILTTKT